MALRCSLLTPFGHTLATTRMNGSESLQNDQSAATENALRRENRLEVARRLGATETVNSKDGKAVEKVMALTAGRGVDTAIEAVGIPLTFLLCQDLVAPGGIIANIGVDGTKVDLHLERLWSENIAITTRLVDTVSTPMLLKTVQSKKINPKLLITHRFKLDKILDAYETFGQAASTGALKVIIEA
jgi:alcohol dehydrogenase